MAKTLTKDPMESILANIEKQMGKISMDKTGSYESIILFPPVNHIRIHRPIHQ